MAGTGNATVKVYATTLLIPLGLFFVLAYIRMRLAPAGVEVAVRSIANLLGLFAVPPLIVFSYRVWAIENRSELPGWRNALGAGSIAILASLWLLYFSIAVFGFLRSTPLFSRDLTPMLLEVSLLAALLAFALKGLSRPLGLSAAVLVLTYLQAGIYR